MRRVAVALRAAAPRLLAVVATTLLTRMIGVIMTAVEIDPAALMIGVYFREAYNECLLTMLFRDRDMKDERDDVRDDVRENGTNGDDRKGIFDHTYGSFHS